jgi:hypothetical protein
MRRRTTVFGACVFGAAMVLGPALPAVAETATYDVGESQLRDGDPTFDAESASDANWYRETTVAGGSVDLYRGSDQGSISPSGAPGFGDGALAITTNHQAGSKAQLLSPHRTFGRALADVDAIDYWTFQDASSEPGTTGPKQLLPALQMQIDTNGFATGGGFTTLVFEPYQETESGPSQPIVPEEWQFWSTVNGRWWSTRDISCVGGTPDPFALAAGEGGDPFTTPAEVAAGCPGAVLIQFGFNVGVTPTEGVVTAVDGLHLGIGADDFTWDFGPK